jgi:DNA invertase Pin-like site-specific DNA recombinase
MDQSESTPVTSRRRPKTAVYFRVSTSLQTAECQKPDVMALLTARGLTPDLIFEERASAVKFRPQFEKMMEAAENGEFTTLVIWALDRFGRSLAGNINDFMALDKMGVKVVSVREPWMDTTGPIRELLIAIFSWAAQQERTRLIERTKAGIAHARRNGKPWGRVSTKLVAPDLRQPIMDQWAAEGRPDGFLGLAAQLGGCSPTTAWKLWNKAHPPKTDATDQTDDSSDVSDGQMDAV